MLAVPMEDRRYLLRVRFFPHFGARASALVLGRIASHVHNIETQNGGEVRMMGMQVYHGARFRPPSAHRTSSILNMDTNIYIYITAINSGIVKLTETRDV